MFPCKSKETLESFRTEVLAVVMEERKALEEWKCSPETVAKAIMNWAVETTAGDGSNWLHDSGGGTDCAEERVPHTVLGSQSGTPEDPRELVEVKGDEPPLAMSPRLRGVCSSLLFLTLILRVRRERGRRHHWRRSGRSRESRRSPCGVTRQGRTRHHRRTPSICGNPCGPATLPSKQSDATG
jgi:hypothetical protein